MSDRDTALTGSGYTFTHTNQKYVAIYIRRFQPRIQSLIGVIYINDMPENSQIFTFIMLADNTKLTSN